MSFAHCRPPVIPPLGDRRPAPEPAETATRRGSRWLPAQPSPTPDGYRQHDRTPSKLPTLVLVNRLDRRVIWIREDVGPEASFLLGLALVADERAEDAAGVFQLPAGQARAAWAGLHGVISLQLPGWHADARPKHWRHNQGRAWLWRLEGGGLLTADAVRVR